MPELKSLVGTVLTLRGRADNLAIGDSGTGFQLGAPLLEPKAGEAVALQRARRR